jgi:hypothetical protein
MESLQIMPEPDEAERQAILAALADEERGRPKDSGWAEALLPAARVWESDEP